MRKTILMLLGFAALFGAAIACFTPSSKKDPSSPIPERTNSTAEAPTGR